MKKIFLCLFVLGILSINLNVLANTSVLDENFKSYNQEASVFVPILKTDKYSYKSGEVIKGEVYIDNNSDLRQSDVYLVTSIVLNIDQNENEVESFKNEQNIYLEAKSRKKIEFTHTINTNINQDVELVATAYAKDGSVLGQKKVPIKILAENPKQIISIKDIYIQQDKTKFSPFVGITVKKDENLFVGFITDSLPSEKIKIKPTINIYNRNNLQNDPIKQVLVDEMTIESNKEYSIKIPTDLDPLVYFGTISFDIPGYILSTINFRYIIEGKIGSILNLNASTLNVKKNETVQIRVEYAGNPIVLNNQTIEDQKKLSTTTNIIFEEEKITNNDAYINISLIDINNNVIGQGRVDVDLSKSGTIVSDIKVNQKSKGFVIKAEMFSNEGVQLSTYTTDLPSEGELKKQYGKKMFNTNDYILLIIILIFIIAASVIYMKFKTRKILFALILSIILLASFLIYVVNVRALTYHFNLTTSNQSTYFKVNSIISPGPAESVTYDPGETFKLELNASYVACANAGFTNFLYGPSQNWSNFNFDSTSLSSIFDYQNLYFYNYAVRTVSHVNIMNYIGDYSSPTIDRFREWWTSNTVLSGVPFFSSGNHVNSAALIPYYNGIFSNPMPDKAGITNRNNIVGKNGVLLFETNAWGQALTAVTKNEYKSNYNMNSGSVTYTMPQTPGFHDFYFMLVNKAYGGHTAATKIVSQRVCVRGAGVCLDESVTSYCPNLTGDFKKVGNIIQRKDGSNWVDTEYIKNSNNQCVPDAHVLSANVNPIGDTTATVNWVYSNILGQKSYEVQISSSPDFISGSILETKTGGAGDINSVFTGLTPNTTYYVRIKVYNGISWSNYVSLNFRTRYDSNECSCQGRNLVCVNATQSVNNSPQCAFNVYCGASIVDNNAVFNITHQNVIGPNISYLYDGNTTTYPKTTPYTISKTKQIGINSVSVAVTDIGDGSQKTTSCSVNSISNPGVITDPDPSIVMTKTGRCNISWNIQNMPIGTICTLNPSGTLVSDAGSEDFSAGLTSNTRYTITCSGPTLSPSMTDSVICRVDPTVIEN